jgi:hypothetical protein
MGLPATVYKRPHGQQIEITMSNITPEDEEWYRLNNIKVGFEEITPEQLVIYAEYGETDGEPDEINYLVPSGEQCIISMSKIRTKIEGIINANK